MQQAPQLVKVNVHEIQEKMQSKKELYNFFTQDCKAYLPKLESISIFFLKEILRGEKEVSSALTFAIVHPTDGGEDCCRPSD